MNHVDAAKLAARESSDPNAFPEPSAPPLAALHSLAHSAIALARRWLSDDRCLGVDARDRETAERLGALVASPAGLEFALRFVDDVARPQDVQVSARALRRLASRTTGARAILGPVDRRLLQLGARVATLAPWLVVPAARARLRQLVGHLVADAGSGLGGHLARTRARGFALNVNLLGEAVLGEDEARARLERTLALVRRPEVDYVSVKVSAVVSQLNPWDLEGSRARVVERLSPLYTAALQHGTFINLDMEEYRDLALTLEAFVEVLSQPQLHGLQAGIALQAYLPDALPALHQLAAFASKRAGTGGAPIKVRLVKGANLAMERVEAELRGWPLAPYDNKPDVDANYVRLLDFALRSEHEGLRVGVASHNLYHVALAILAARARGIAAMLDVEMLQGMAPGQARAVRDEMAVHGGRVVLYTPVVAASDFDVAIAYLVRRLEENAARQNFLYALFAPDVDVPPLVSDDLPRAHTERDAEASDAAMHATEHDTGAPNAAMCAQERAFVASVTAGASSPPAHVTPHRGLRRVGQHTTFRNAQDTDPTVAEHRRWARALVSTPPDALALRTAMLTSTAAVDAAVDDALRAQVAWARAPGEQRAEALRAVARQLERARSELVRVMVHEAGKTVAEADPEVSEAVDFATYYADRALELDTVRGARFVPGGVSLVTPPWNFPCAIAAGGVLASLAAGSAVIAKPPPPTPRCLEVTMECIHAGLAERGVDPLVAQLVRVPDDALGEHLVTHEGISRVLLTGAIDTAQRFVALRAERPVFAETSGKNAIVVTPAADLDLAVADVVRSAFGHAGQKCSACSLVILVGSVADPRKATGARFRRQLVDAVRSIAVGPATNIATAMGPLIEPPHGKLLRALTTLDAGERWVVPPRRIDAAGTLWTPGLKEGVTPGSHFHFTECFGPVLGLMTADTLDDALALQNAVRFGLTGGLHSLDDAEITHWLERVQVGNAYINRSITGAIVRRQPFGGWKASCVGPGAKAGGPNYVAQLGVWCDDAHQVPDRERDPSAWLAWAFADDARCWATDLGIPHDPSGLSSESNLLRYVPVDDMTVRVGRGALPVEVERVLGAAQTAGVGPRVSYAEGPRAESDDAFAARVAQGHVVGRVRVLGASPGLRDAAATQVGRVDVLDQPVLASGRRELLSMLREQTVSRIHHRYGHLRTASEA
ncbi:MAG: proline dehydrogenase family protein [Polyangiales bacterium]